MRRGLAKASGRDEIPTPALTAVRHKVRDAGDVGNA